MPFYPVYDDVKPGESIFPSCRRCVCPNCLSLDFTHIQPACTFTDKLAKLKESHVAEISKLKALITDSQLRADRSEHANTLAEARFSDARDLGAAQLDAAVNGLKAVHGEALLAAFEKGAQFVKDLMSK